MIKTYGYEQLINFIRAAEYDKLLILVSITEYYYISPYPYGERYLLVIPLCGDG